MFHYLSRNMYYFAVSFSEKHNFRIKKKVAAYKFTF